MIPQTLTERFQQARALEALRLQSLELLEDIAHWNLVSQARALEEELRGEKAGFNPGQPRAPLGSPNGGQWVSGGGGASFTETPPKEPRGGDLTEALIREALQRILGQKLPKLPKTPGGILNFSEGDSAPPVDANFAGIARIFALPAVLEKIYGVFRTAVGVVQEIISLSDIFGEGEGPPPDPSGGEDSPDSGEGPGEDPGRPKGVPDSWVEGPSDKPGGIKYTDPRPKSGNEVRIMRGNPNSPYPSSREPYVSWTKNGQRLDINGKVVPKNSPEAHIPLRDFKFDPKIFK